MRFLSSRSLAPLYLLIALPLFLLLAGCPKPKTPADANYTPPAVNAKAPAGEPIKIGAIFAVTGPGAPLGEPEQAAAKMVEEKLNAAGGIKGRPVQLIIEDDASDETKAKLAAKKLIEQDKVCAIIGPTTSGPSLAVIEPCETAQIPLITCAASVKITNPVKKWVFSTAQTDVLAVQRLIGYLDERKFKNVAIICDSNAFGQSGADQLKALLPKANVKIVDEEKFGSKDTDMTAQLTKIKAKDPQAIICWGTNPGPAVVAKNVKSMGLKSALIMSHGIANMKFIELAADAAEGVVFPAGKLLIKGELPDSDPQKAVLTDFSTQFEAAAKKPANTFGGHAFDALQILKAAIEKAGTDAAALRDAIEATKSYAGIGGVFNLSATDHNGLTKDAFALVTIKGGKWTQVK